MVRQQPTSNDGFTLLQSMLYHSQQITTHYWLTPLLAYIHRNRGEKVEHYYHYLQHLDNHLLCSNDERPLIERTWDFLGDKKGVWQHCNCDCSVLKDSLGVAFPHYWFYKLEFILWVNREEILEEMKNKYKELMENKDYVRLWNEFRLTAKNSVEHISPQTPQDIDTNRVSSEVLHTFGNLALVSRSINAEFGNLPFNERRERFLNRNRSKLDSLKMALIYQNDKWNNTRAADHQRQMIEFIELHLKKDFQREKKP